MAASTMLFSRRGRGKACPRPCGTLRISSSSMRLAPRRLRADDGRGFGNRNPRLILISRNGPDFEGNSFLTVFISFHVDCFVLYSRPIDAFGLLGTAVPREVSNANLRSD